MRRFWCTSCFVGERLSDALLFASSNLTNTNSRADIKDGWTGMTRICDERMIGTWQLSLSGDLAGMEGKKWADLGGRSTHILKSGVRGLLSIYDVGDKVREVSQITPLPKMFRSAASLAPDQHPCRRFWEAAARQTSRGRVSSSAWRGKKETRRTAVTRSLDWNIQQQAGR